MGKFFWYKTGKLGMSSPQLYGYSGLSNQINLPYMWKDTSGADLTSIYGCYEYNPMYVSNLKASADVLEDAKYDDYATNELNSVAVSSANQLFKIDERGVAYVVSSITISNNNITERTVNCVKKVGYLRTYASSQITTRPVLFWAYFFDKPIILQPLEKFTFDLTVSLEQVTPDPEI